MFSHQLVSSRSAKKVTMTKSMSQFEIILFKLENVTTRMTQYLMKSFLVQKVVVNLTHITRVHNYIYEHSNGVIEINKSYLLTITVCKNRIFPESCELIELKKKKTECHCILVFSNFNINYVSKQKGEFH